MPHPATTARHDPPTAPADRHARLALLCCLGAGFATLLDHAVLNLAVPSLTAALDADTGQVQWLLASYSLTFALGLVPGGRLGDAFGRRGLFVTGLLVFVVGALASAGAPDVWWVVAGRVVQGFGAGLTSAQVLGIVQDRFTGPRRVRALAAYTSAGAAAALVGPLAAGATLALLPEAWAWRVVLLLHVPFALATLTLALRVLPGADGPRRRPDLDLPGIVLLAAVTVLVTLPVVDPGLPPAATVGIGAAVLLLGAALVRWEVRYTARGRLALFAPALVRQAGFVTGNVVALLWFGALVGHGTVLTLHLLQGAGMSGLAVAVVLVPAALSRIAGSTLAARVFARRGPRTVTVALLVQALAVAALAVAGSLADGARLLVAVAVVEAALGVASGLVEPPLRAVTLGFAPAGLHGVAASFLQLTQRLSATFCVAVATGLLFWGSGAGTVTTARSFVVALAFCATLLGLAAAVSAARWLHAPPGPAVVPDVVEQREALAVVDGP